MTKAKQDYLNGQKQFFETAKTGDTVNIPAGRNYSKAAWESWGGNKNSVSAESELVIVCANCEGVHLKLKYPKPTNTHSALLEALFSEELHKVFIVPFFVLEVVQEAPKPFNMANWKLEEPPLKVGQKYKSEHTDNVYLVAETRTSNSIFSLINIEAGQKDLRGPKVGQSIIESTSLDNLNSEMEISASFVLVE